MNQFGKWKIENGAFWWHRGNFLNKTSLLSHFHDIMILRWIMYIDYSKLWIKLAAMGIKNKTELIPLAGISSNILVMG